MSFSEMMTTEKIEIEVVEGKYGDPHLIKVNPVVRIENGNVEVIGFFDENGDFQDDVFENISVDLLREHIDFETGEGLTPIK